MTLELIPAEDVTEDTSNSISIEDEIKKRFSYVINYFYKNNPNPNTELKHNNGYELLVATILSAQCTDKTVNRVAPALFKKYPNPEALSKATSDDIFQYISSVTFANNKSDYLKRMAKMLIDKYNGEIPKDVNRLQKLPGVGRKTAHVILATLFEKPVIAVDTHVMMVSERIGLTTGAKNPLEVEEQLMIYTPKEVMYKISHWLILHGRYICIARNPKCNQCEIREICRYYNN